MMYHEKFYNLYENDIKLRRLIKNRVFTYNNGDTWVKFKITNLKIDDHSNVNINIKICGKIKKYTWTSNIYPLDSKYGFNSSISRNTMLRNDYARPELQKFFKLFGIESYWIKVGKLNIVNETKF